MFGLKAMPVSWKKHTRIVKSTGSDDLHISRLKRPTYSSDETYNALVSVYGPQKLSQGSVKLFPSLFNGFCCPTNGYILLVMSNLVYWKLPFDKFARPLPGTMHVRGTGTNQFSLQFSPHPPRESLVKHLYLRDRTGKTLSECEFYKSVKPFQCRARETTFVYLQNYTNT